MHSRQSRNYRIKLCTRLCASNGTRTSSLINAFFLTALSSNTEERAQTAESKVAELEVELRDALDKLRALEKKNIIDMSLIDPPPIKVEKTKTKSESKLDSW